MPGSTKSPQPPKRSLFVKVMDRLAWRWRLQVMRVIVRPMDARAPPIAVEGVVVRTLTPAETLAACADPRFAVTPLAVEEAFARGDEVVGAFLDGRLSGFVWSAYRIAPDVDGIWVEVPPEAVYKYRSFVVPELRGRRIAPAIYRHADLLALAAGRKVSVGFITVQNAPSIAVSTALGGGTAGFAAYWKLGRTLWTFHSPAVRRLGLRFHL